MSTTFEQLEQGGKNSSQVEMSSLKLVVKNSTNNHDITDKQKQA